MTTSNYIKRQVNKMLTLPGFTFAHDILSANHCLIGGCTGSGKSVLLNDILYTLTGYNPKDNVCIIIDLKRIDFLQWEKFPHVLKIVTDPGLVIPYIDFIINEMENRYSEMEKNRTKNCDAVSLYLIIDEFAQLLTIPGCEQRIVKLGRLARAADIHVILATQDVSKKTISAQIQQNFVYTIGLKCRDKIASKQIIGKYGCETLPRYGKAIVCNGMDYNTIDVPFITEDDIKQRYIDTMNYYGKEMQA